VKNKSYFIFIGVTFFVFFVAFTFIVKKDLLTNLDFNLTVRLQDKLPRKLDTFFGSFSFAARAEILTFLLLLVLLLRKRMNGLYIFLLFVFGHVIELVGKSFLHHPGPIALFYRQDALPMFRDYVKPGSSYPSGHSFRAMFLAIFISALILYSQKLTISKKYFAIFFLFLFVFFVCLAKIALGQHWTSDVVGGVLLGVSLGFLSILPILVKK